MLPTNDVDVHIPLQTEKVGVSPGGVTCAETKRQRCKNIPKKRGRMTRWTPQRLKAAQRPDLGFSGGTSAHGTVRSSRKSRYLMEDGVWRGCCRSFSAPPAPAGLPILGAMRPLPTPNSCAPPFREVSGQNSTQPRPCLDEFLCSSIFHLAHTSTATASISESGSTGSGSCREAVKQVERP